MPLYVSIQVSMCTRAHSLHYAWCLSVYDCECGCFILPVGSLGTLPPSSGATGVSKGVCLYTLCCNLHARRGEGLLSSCKIHRKKERTDLSP